MDEMPTTLPAAMPPEIAAAIAEVMANVKKLAKGDINQYARYNYASIDAFLEAVGPLCAAAGLFFILDEAETETVSTAGKDSSILRVRWHVWIGHRGGGMYGPVNRSVDVQAVGAQAYGSAQSYTLKQFMRALFQIPTGDQDDPDALPHAVMPAQQRRQTRPAAKPQPKKPAAKPQTQGGDVFEEARLMIEAAADRNDHIDLARMADRVGRSAKFDQMQKDKLMLLCEQCLDKIAHAHIKECKPDEAEGLRDWWKNCEAASHATRDHVLKGLNYVIAENIMQADKT